MTATNVKQIIFSMEFNVSNAIRQNVLLVSIIVSIAQNAIIPKGLGEISVQIIVKWESTLTQMKINAKIAKKAVKSAVAKMYALNAKMRFSIKQITTFV